MKKKKYLLEVAVPTYNRTKYLSKCLDSIFISLKNINQKEKKLIGLVINDNSTLDLSNRKRIIKVYKSKFEKTGIGYFIHRITGFNIGPVNNIASVLANSNSEYIWLLPDDDTARFDSLKIIIKSILKHKPSFIIGGWVKKSKMGYLDGKLKNDDLSDNIIFNVVNGKNKIDTFLSKSVVQAQEYVYKSKKLDEFFQNDEKIKLLNFMSPGLLGIYCLKDQSPLILLKNSIGIFRHDEPDSESEWRHLWLKITLQDWPDLSKKMYELGWITYKQFIKSKNIYKNLIYSAPYRPDLFLGLNPKYKLSFFKLWHYHRKDLIKSIILSVPAIFKEVLKRFLNLFRA